MRMLGLGVVLLGLLVAAGGGAAQPRPQGDVSQGEQVYKALCWTCHGRYGRGDGPAAQYLATAPPDFTDPAVLGRKSDREVIAHLLEARGLANANHTPMIIGQVLKKEALEDVIAYIRTLSVPGKHVSIPAGKDIYNTFC